MDSTYTGDSSPAHSHSFTKTHEPHVTIITPFKNANSFINDYVYMLKAQTYPNWSAILVDDGSTDDSLDLLQAYVSDDTRFVVKKLNPQDSCGSPAPPRNLALTLVDGPLVAFCDIDDLWHPSKLTIQVTAHLKSEASLTVTSYCRFKNNLSGPILSIRQPPYKVTLRRLLSSNHIPLSTALLDTQLITHFKAVPHEDYLFWLEIFSSYPNLHYLCIPDVLTFYRVHTGGISANKFLVPIWTFSVYRKYGLSVLNSLRSVTFWAFMHAIEKFRCLLIDYPSSLTPQSLLAMRPLHPRQVLLFSKLLGCPVKSLRFSSKTNHS